MFALVSVANVYVVAVLAAAYVFFCGDVICLSCCCTFAYPGEGGSSSSTGKAKEDLASVTLSSDSGCLG